MRAWMTLLVGPLLMAATCDGPRVPMAPLVSDPTPAAELTESPAVWVLVRGPRHSGGPGDRHPVVFSEREANRVFVRLGSGREVVLVGVPVTDIDAAMLRLPGPDVLERLGRRATRIAGPFVGRIPHTGAVYPTYDRVLYADGVDRWLLLIDVDQRPREGVEFVGTFFGEADTRGSDYDPHIEFVPLAYVQGLPERGAATAATEVDPDGREESLGGASHGGARPHRRPSAGGAATAPVREALGESNPSSPATSPSETSISSVLKPRRSPQRRYMRSSMLAQSCASVPPEPAWIST